MIPVNAKCAELPSFMTFDFTPEEGPHLSIKPYQKSPEQEAPRLDLPKWQPVKMQWGERPQENSPSEGSTFYSSLEGAKIIGRNTITGSAIGFVGGVACFTVGTFVQFTVNKILPPPLDEVTSNDAPKETTTAIGAATLMGTYALVGSAIGGFFGAARGVTLTRKFYLDCPQVIHATLDSRKQAQKIIKIFVKSQIEELNKEGVDIECPVAHEIMVFPADVDCPSKIPHTFEFFTILQWLKKTPTCPLCTGKVNIGKLTLNEKKEQKIRDIAGAIFKKMEAILQNLPKRFCDGDGLPNFFESQNIATLGDMVGRGGKFLEGDIKEIRAKINNPGTLSLEETYALGYFLIHQFKPLKHKIDQIYQILTSTLVEMRTQEKIDGQDLTTQLAQVQRWYEAFDIIPNECKIIRKLYQI